MVPWGYVSSSACDPIEKKPFFHFIPGSSALSFGMLGCNLRCPFCQNWSISQALRDEAAAVRPRPISAAAIMDTARRRGCRVVSSTYNEPLISTEWAVDIFRRARAAGMKTCYVSNGFASAEVLDYLEPWLDAMNIDLKCFTESGYRWLGGRLAPVLDAIRQLWAAGTWVEVITLVVPGFNDTDAELGDIAAFLASVSPDIPWHVSAYHKDYRMSDGPLRTPLALLRRAVSLGREAGLRYVYTGNAPGLDGSEDTSCHRCGALLISRYGFRVGQCMITPEGACPACGAHAAGVWS
jgi:pyruvate formate lyase activating enzyme